MAKNYIIEISGGHLSSPRYVHHSGMLIKWKQGAEKFSLEDALESIWQNIPETTCKLKAVYYPGKSWTYEKSRAAILYELRSSSRN